MRTNRINAEDNVSIHKERELPLGASRLHKQFGDRAIEVAQSHLDEAIAHYQDMDRILYWHSIKVELKRMSPDQTKD